MSTTSGFSPSRRPSCPNHGCPLTKSGTPGIGICPISDARFAYDEEAEDKKQKLRINAFGQMEEVPDWNVQDLGEEDA